MKLDYYLDLLLNHKIVPLSGIVYLSPTDPKFLAQLSLEECLVEEIRKATNRKYQKGIDSLINTSFFSTPDIANLAEDIVTFPVVYMKRGNGLKNFSRNFNYSINNNKTFFGNTVSIDTSNYIHMDHLRIIISVDGKVVRFKFENNQFIYDTPEEFSFSDGVINE